MSKILINENGKALMSADGKVYKNPEGMLIPTGSLEITENGTHNVREYEEVNVNVAGGGGGNTLKALLDTTKAATYLFQQYKGNSVEDLISYDDTENVTNMGYMFNGCSNLQTIPLLDTSNATYMGNMFNNCSKLTTIPQLDTSNVNHMGYMFNGCSNLQTIPQLDTSNVTNMGNMFNNCSKLTTIPPLDTSNVTYMGNMFNGCSKLLKLDISHYNIGSTSSINNFCALNLKLKTLIIRSFGTNYVLNSSAFYGCYYMLGQTNSTHNPNGEQGYVYVPRDMISILQNETNWSKLQFRALEDYTLDGTTTGQFDDAKAGL